MLVDKLHAEVVNSSFLQTQTIYIMPCWIYFFIHIHFFSRWLKKSVQCVNHSLRSLFNNTSNQLSLLSSVNVVRWWNLSGVGTNSLEVRRAMHSSTLTPLESNERATWNAQNVTQNLYWGQYHSYSAFQQNNITTFFASPASEMIGDVVKDINANAAACSDEQAKVLVPPSATIDSSARSHPGLIPRWSELWGWFLKNPLTGETGVRGFSKPGEGLFFLMKTVRRSYPHRLSFRSLDVWEFMSYVHKFITAKNLFL
jgi:hypothetical protein